MTRGKLLAITAPIAALGLAVALHGTMRVNARTEALSRARAESDAAAASFVKTLQGEHAERQRLAFDRRRALALALAAARRDRMLGVLVSAAAALAAGGLAAFSRIAAEIEEDRRHVAAQRGDPGPNRS